MNRKLNRIEILELLSGQSTSGMSAKEYCREKQIPYSTFLYWSRRERTSGEGTKGFLPLQVREAPHSDGSVSELITPTGWRIVLARPVELGRLIHLLR
jgi:hypothetical protein